MKTAFQIVVRLVIIGGSAALGMMCARAVFG